MDISAVEIFNARIALAVQWLVETKPERPRIPKLREKFGLNAKEAIAALKLAAEEEARRT
jgi:hypothetical protein